MNPIQRTLVFVVVAAVSTGVAFTANQFTKPAKTVVEYGQDFFPDFTDPSKASAIQVVSFDEATAASKVFTVVNKDGGWQIPSYHGYPADGKEQLAKAASSVIGLKKGTRVTRSKTEHERFGVIDPLDEENPSIKGRGTRISLLEKGETKLADLIIGKKVEGSEDKVYLRREDENNVYMVSAKFDISTKFADWAETDLLKLAAFDLVRLRAARPKYNESDELEGMEVVEITREKSSDPWKLPELDEATEELKTEDINAMVTTLDDLRLVGVRPKPQFGGKPVLNSDLKIQLPKEYAADPQFRRQVVDLIQSSLREKGFFVGKDDAGEQQIVSREGEINAATKDGVVYRLTFGSVFSGTEEEIEIGKKEEAKTDDKADASSDKKKDAKKPAKKEDLKKSRYLFVRAEFDEKLLGNPPIEPTKPEPPPGVEPTEALKSDADPKKDEETKRDEDKKSEPAPEAKSNDKESTTEKPADSKKETDEPQGSKGDDKVAAAEDTKKADAKDAKAESKETPPKTEDKPAEKKAEDEKKADEKPAADKTDSPKSGEAPKKDPKAEYQDARKRYDGELGRYNTEMKVFESKLETGRQKVKELNERFADWYYVISNDSFEKLRLSRADLIKKKDKPVAENATEKKDDEKKADEKKADEKKADEKKADEPKADADAAKPAEKPASDKKAADQK